MLDNIGTLFNALPELTHVRDLEAFEGPILSELRADGGKGKLYLEKWCTWDRDGTVRTLVVPGEQRPVAEYMAGRWSMLDLLTRPNGDVGFLVDSLRGERLRVAFVQVSTLPRSYLPKPTARHDESLRPEWETTPQTFLFGQTWDAKLLSDLEKLYLTTYAFNYFTDPARVGDVPSAMLTYELHGGFAYGRMFQMLRREMPKNDNARSAIVAAASPGVLTIEAPTATAERLSAALSAAARQQTRKAYDNVHAWSRLKPERANLIPQTARDQLVRLCDLLDVDAHKILHPKDDGSVDDAQLLRAGKVAAAYYRQLWRLLDPSNGVEFLTTGVEREETEPPQSVYEEEDETEEVAW